MSVYRSQLQLAMEEFLPAQFFVRWVERRIPTGSRNGFVGRRS
jgi:hypothetical protein